MVSDDVLDKLDGDDDDSSSSSSSKRGRRSKEEKNRAAQDTVADAYSPDGDEFLDPEDVDIQEQSKNFAGKNGADWSSDGEGLAQYKKKQVKECREFIQDMKEQSEEYGESMPTFTMVFHAMVMNFAQMRAGIAETLMEEYNMEKKEAIEHSDQIARKAGEYEGIQDIINWLNKRILDA